MLAKPATIASTSPAVVSPIMSKRCYDLPEPSLEWDSGQPVSTQFEDVYFSRESGLAEARHVFIDGNDLPARFSTLPTDRPGAFCIGETGFGTGLNLLATLHLWQQLAPSNWRLHWLSTELYPLTRTALQQAVAAWPELAAEAELLLAAYPPRLKGHHWRWLIPGRASLGLWHGDATEGLAALLDSADPSLAQAGPRIDAWLLDGFAPARNPAMWQSSLYQQLQAWSRPGTTFATFTAAGHVRRGLQAVGFHAEKRPGFGRKREMLSGIYTGARSAEVKSDSDDSCSGPSAVRPVDYWAMPILPPPTERTAIIVGAGLAGSATARALAQRGWQVIVLDRADEIAAEASGNAQGVLYTRFSTQPDPLSRFALHSYLHAVQHYRALAASGALQPDEYDFCGMLQRPADEAQAHRQQAVAQAFDHHPDWLQWLEREAAEQRAGLSLPGGGLWLPQSGWLAPAAVCRAQLSHPAIEVRLGMEVQTLTRGPGRWQLTLKHGETLTSDVVIACSGTGVDWLTPWFRAPTRSVRGQVTQVTTTDTPHCVLCHEGYIAPAMEGKLWIGATFDAGDSDPQIRIADHYRNLASLKKAIPALEDAALVADAGRVGFRAASPDHLPLVGPVPVQPDFDHCYASLRTQARRPVPQPPPLWPGLLINLGHGARGLTSTPLCAELVAALASGEMRPVERSLMHTVTPLRFAARALIRAS